MLKGTHRNWIDSLLANRRYMQAILAESISSLINKRIQQELPYCKS